MGYKQTPQTNHLALYSGDDGLTAKSLIDAMKIGLLLFDEDCRVVLANQPALTIIDNRDWLWLSDKRLKSTSLQISEVEETIISIVQQPNNMGSEKPVILCAQGQSDHLMMDFSLLNAEDDHTLAVCLIVDPFARRPLDSSALGDMFGLTETEVAITSRIADGLDYKAIATERQLSIETIRTYSKSIFKKVGVNSRAGLVCKVHSTLSPLSLLN